MIARRIAHKLMANVEPFLILGKEQGAKAARQIVRHVDSGKISLSHRAGLSPPFDCLARQGFLEFVLAEPLALRLTPCSTDFATAPIPAVTKGIWKLSRFAYAHIENGRHIVRNPNSDCFLTIECDRLAAVLHRLARPTDISKIGLRLSGRSSAAAALGAMARAKVILECDQAGQTFEDRDPAHRQWEFHDLLFHSLSRTGRSEKEIGGTYRFKGELPPPPAVKKHSWTQPIIPLPKAGIAALMVRDAPFTAVLEQRRSIRHLSVVPLSKQQIGEFLFRVCRVRQRLTNASGEFTSRPYPGAGACYEQEFYLTIDACLDLPRGFYYYDPVAHALCLVSPANQDTEGLLTDAWTAMGMQSRPQVLITIASRFPRFNWKYTAIAYASQLKNVGVIYQTMYLVATAMQIAACALGVGNTNRFAALTGLPYLEESSIGEFALGRPS